jgi:hypothetical protein
MDVAPDGEPATTIDWRLRGVPNPERVQWVDDIHSE